MSRNRDPSARALLVGAIGAALIGAGVPYCNMVLQGSRIASHFNTPAAIILFFLLVFLLNSGVGFLRRGWMLGPGELVLIYVMWIVATAIPEYGLTSFLLTDITALIYYATPENGWRELILPFVPEWIIPHREPGPIGHFYEGAPHGVALPWKLWLRPLAFWIPFVLALYLTMIAVAVILRKQWIERERLVFPLAQLPLAMIGTGAGRASGFKRCGRGRS